MKATQLILVLNILGTSLFANAMQNDSSIKTTNNREPAFSEELDDDNALPENAEKEKEQNPKSDPSKESNFLDKET